MAEKIPKKSVANVPELLKEWDYEKNISVRPEDVSWKSSKKVWWKCDKGHSWQQNPCNRMNKCGCPYCAGKKVWPGFNDLATINPNLVKEWDYEANEPVRPSDIMPHSGKKYQWKCSKGHTWQATVANRSNGYGCPYCASKKVCIGFNDLKSRSPELASEWNYEYNKPLLPEAITLRSNKSVWWKCMNGHYWQDTPANRAAGRDCPYCSGHRVWVGFNDLETINPSLATEWNYEKNSPLKPQDFTAGSRKKVWWRCKRGHEWKAAIATRNQGIGCPFCSGRYAIAGETDLATINPTLAEEWDDQKNIGLDPSTVCANSEKKVWWKCPICKHEWQATPSSRNSGGHSCPACNKRNRTSFPEQAIFYYVNLCLPEAVNSYTDIFNHGMELDIYIPSLKIGIEYDGPFHKGSKRDAIKYNICRQHKIRLIRISEIERDSIESICDVFIDSKYLRSDEGGLDKSIITLLNELNMNNTDVNIRRDRNKIYSQYLTRLKKNSLSMRYPRIAKEWNEDKNGDLTPEMFNWGSGEKVWWKCSTCKHEWQAVIASRTGGGVGCPVCGRQKIKEGQIKSYKKCGRKKLIDYFPELVIEWDYEKNVGVDITQILLHSNQKVWWKCKQGHSWQAVVNNRTNGRNCPYCSGKKVLKGFNDFKSMFPELALSWDFEKNATLEPDQVLPFSNQKVWWVCEKGHGWQATISSISLGGWCPYCQGKKVLAGFNDLMTLRPELMKEWNYERNGDILPSQFTEHSGQKVWWKCSACEHEWQAVIDSRSNGHGCPICAHKIVAKKLSERYKR